MHKYDDYFELLGKDYLYTLFNIIIFILSCQVGLPVDFFSKIRQGCKATIFLFVGLHYSFRDFKVWQSKKKKYIN